MVNKHIIKGYTDFCEKMKNFDGVKQEVYLYFGGSKNEKGESWCGDCVRAFPVIEKALEKASANSHFIQVEVGDRPTWKDPKCPFRTDKRTNLLVIPTLIKWQHPKKLEGEHCENAEIVEMLFEDDD